MRGISILVKPASSNCNLSCKYCFYKDVSENREIYSKGIMSVETVDNLVRKAFTKENKYVSFSFQGGEPTLTGLSFYIDFIEVVKKHNLYNANVSYSIQTNGYTLDKAWGKFFKENNFLVGISLDGPKEIHDEIRIISLYKGTYKKVMDAIKLLNRYEVQLNILCVLTTYNCRHIEKVYKFFQKNELKYLQFIPCLEPLESNDEANKYSLKNSDYFSALNRLFKLYKEDYFNNNYTSIRLFDNYVRMLLGEAPENCSLSGICSCYFVIEANGDTYPCDFYCVDKYLIGNININTFDEMNNNEAALEFINESRKLDDKCLSCTYFKLCRGGCKRYRYIENEKGIGFNYFCNAYYDFFKDNISGLIDIAKAEKNMT